MNTENEQVVIDEPTLVDQARAICAMSDTEDFESFAEVVRVIAPYEIVPLARAVIELTAKVELVEVLADELDEVGGVEIRTISGEVLGSEYAKGLRYAATRIRDALNGDIE